MKKILLCVAALSLSACTPAVADPEIKEWNTYNSMGCMMLRECKEGTEPIRSWIDLCKQFKPWKDELTKIFDSMNQAQIGAYIDDEKYFVDGSFGDISGEGNNELILILTNPNSGSRVYSWTIDNNNNFSRLHPPYLIKNKKTEAQPISFDLATI